MTKLTHAGLRAAIRARDGVRNHLEEEYDHDGVSWETLVAWYAASLDVMVARRASQIEHGYPAASIKEMDQFVAESRSNLEGMTAMAAEDGVDLVPLSIADKILPLIIDEGRS